MDLIRKYDSENVQKFERMGVLFEEIFKLKWEIKKVLKGSLEYEKISEKLCELVKEIRPLEKLLKTKSYALEYGKELLKKVEKYNDDDDYFKTGMCYDCYTFCLDYEPCENCEKD